MESNMQKLINWFNENNLQINWFLIGYFFSIGLSAFADGNYGGALIGFGFAALNYVLNRN
jgi:hypothetical protein